MAEDDKQLKAHRAQIDALDDEILALLEKRAGLAQAIGEQKRQRQEKTFSVAEREAEILRRLQDGSALLKPHITAIYREIIAACLACEKPLTIAYLGPAGTYTHEAALKMFGQAAQFEPAPTIRAAIQLAEKERCDYAVVPFENSSAGTVGATMEALTRTPLTIGGESVLRIRHNLLAAEEGAALADIKEIHAHPQALEQCSQWLAQHAGQAALHAADSNAAAAATAKARGRAAAAIGSRTAQSLYQLALLTADIEDHSNNSTRFLVLGQRQPAASGADKTSFIMTVKDEAGAMLNVLRPLADNHVNMVKLESHPMPDRLWEYLFFVDCIGHQSEENMAAALRQARERASFLKVLGSYPQAIA